MIDSARDRQSHMHLLAGAILAAALLFSFMCSAFAVAERHPARRAPRAHGLEKLSALDSILTHTEKLLKLSERATLAALRDSIATIAIPEITLTGLALPEGTIYATEIMIDPSGTIMVVDRDGTRYHQIGLELPDIPRRVSLRNYDRGDHDVTHRDVIHIGSDVTIEENKVVEGNVVCIFGSITVHGRVTGSAVSIMGNIDVYGDVGQDVIAPFGMARVNSDALVRGNVVGSPIRKEPGGQIEGMRNEILLDFFGEDWQAAGRLWTRTTMTAIVILKTLFLLFLVMLAHAMAGHNIVKIKRELQAKPIKSFLTGVLAQVLLLPAILILLVTIIGIPVAIFLVPLMMVAAVVLAIAAAGLLVGEKIDLNTGIHLRSPLTRMMLGLVFLQSASLATVAAMWLAELPGDASGMFRLLAFALAGLTALVGYVVMTVGTGAVVLTRFGTRPRDDTVGAQEAGASDPNASNAGPTPLPQTAPGAPPADDAGTAPAIS